MSDDPKPKVLASILFDGLPCVPLIDDGITLSYDDPRSTTVDGLSVTLTFAQWTVKFDPEAQNPPFPPKNHEPIGE